MTIETQAATAPEGTTEGGATAAASESTAGADASKSAAPAVDGQAPAAGGEAKGTAPGADAKAGGEEKVLKAPAEYKFQLPEGANMESEALSELAGLAREFDLPQESAQKVADLGVKMLSNFAASQKAALDTAVAGWEAAAAADKEIGGDAFKENMSVANKALTAFGTPELSALLKETRMGSHPEFTRLMVRVGKAISEDKLVTGGSGAKPDGSAASVLYPNQKLKA